MTHADTRLSSPNQRVISVVLVYSSAPRQTREWLLNPAEGTTLRQAVIAAGVLNAFAGLDIDTLIVGIWGKRCGLNQPLKDQDRIEIYRPLRVDPMVARRERFSRQGVKRAGLFAAKRPDAKAGYGG